MKPLIVLDVNETLSDVSTMGAAFASAGLPASDVPSWFNGVLRDGFALTALGATPSFAALARDSLHGMLAGRADADDLVDQVMAAFGELPVHPDVAPGLRSLHDAGHRIVTLSNGAASVAERLLTRAGLADVVDAFLTVEDAGAWKPMPVAYVHALTTCDVRADDAVMVAAHAWDIDGASRAGLRTVYVDRGRRRPYPGSFTAPDVTVAGLDEIAARFG